MKTNNAKQVAYYTGPWRIHEGLSIHPNPDVQEEISHKNLIETWELETHNSELGFANDGRILYAVEGKAKAVSLRESVEICAAMCRRHDNDGGSNGIEGKARWFDLIASRL